LIVAEKLGYTLAELQERITVEELELWSVFYDLRNEEEKRSMDRAMRRR